MKCEALKDKRVTVHSTEGIVVGTLVKVDCPMITLKTTDGRTKECQCTGMRPDDTPLTADSFWSDVIS